jgi:hypothetical protein
MSSPQYFLRPHVYFCHTPRYTVFLDLTRDQYLSVQSSLFESLSPWLAGEEGRAAPRGAKDPSTEERQLANALIGKGLLSEVAEGSKAAVPIEVPTPTSCFEARSPVSIFSSAMYAPHFWLACAKAARLLQEQPIECVVNSIRKRSADHHGAARRPLRKIHALLSAFKALRLFYPRSYLCLFDSLALIEFLARYNVFPLLVFGVAADPFKAHCWVQDGGIVLNDDLHRISAFTPIMIV